MENPQHNATENRLEWWVGKLLRTGVIVSAAIIALGGAIYLARHGLSSPAYGVFHGVKSDWSSVSGIVGSAFHGGGRGVIQLGLLLLIATPVVRVMLLVVGFAWQRDRLYTIISLVVLTLLLYSLFGGGLS